MKPGIRGGIQNVPDQETVNQLQHDEIAQFNFSFDTFSLPSNDLIQATRYITSPEFYVEVKSILTLSHGDNIFEYTDAEIALEKVGALCQSLITALYEMKKFLNNLKDDFDVWLAQQSKVAEVEIKQNRKLDIENKERKDIGQITKDQIFSQMVSDNARSRIYVKKKKEINNLTNAVITVEKTHDNLNNRGMHLCNLLKKEKGYSNWK